jgi:hypothetical protein
VLVWIALLPSAPSRKDADMTLITEMQAESLIRMDRWAWIGARMAEYLTQHYGKTLLPHEPLCTVAYHVAADEWERISAFMSKPS